MQPPEQRGYMGFAETSDDEEASLPQQSCCMGSSANHEDETRFSNIGLMGVVSHDGAEHVTDEVFNAASHLFGGLLSVLGSTVLITGAAAQSNVWGVISFSFYGASMVALFFASFAHHGLKGSKRLMDILRNLDYVAIYFLIPGTMMPVCFVCLHDSYLGWVFFGTSTGLALVGVFFQTMCPLEFPMWASMTMYLTLGGFGTFLALPAYHCVQFGGAMLLLLGGIAYSVGGIIFTLQWPNPVPGKFGFHEIWHVLVLAGAAFHYCTMFFYVYPFMGEGSPAQSQR